MKYNTPLILGIVSAVFVSGTFAAVVVQERQKKREPRKVTRVKRPQFTEQDWDGIYFKDLFKEGLVGERPTPQTGPATTPSQVADSETQPDQTFAWSKQISGSTLEDEVKALQQRIAKDVTTPLKFKSEYAKAHQSFSILSMVFGIIREYDSDVRWKKYAPAAQASFQKAAANSRVGTSQAFQSCKTRSEDLQGMIRGESFAGTEKPAEQLDWSLVVDRNPIMYRLETSRVRLKEMTSNEAQFTKEISNLFHESQMVAAMAQTILRENMPEADEDSYIEYAQQMSKAANQAAKACQTQNFEEVSKAVNLMNQSCSNCHDDWK